VNWFAIRYGQEEACESKFRDLIQQDALVDFNKIPSLIDGESTKLTSYSFESGIKTTVTMTSHARAKLKIKI